MRFLFFGVFVFFISAGFAQPKVQKEFEWFQKGYYILNPSVSNNKSAIAFVCLLSGRDSSVSPGRFLSGVKENLLPAHSDTSRLYDPVVTLIKTQTKYVSLIDFGWSPTFSPDDRRIAYTYQQQSLKKQDAVYASSVRGNSIKVFNVATKKADEVARPPGSFLLDPYFRDSANIVYKIGNTVNGPYGGGVAFNEVNLVTRKITSLRMPVIRYRLYELMGTPYKIRDRLALTVYSPADSGRGMADEYHHLLLSGKDTLYNFGVSRFTNLNYKFACTGKNEWIILDENHYGVEDTNFVVKYRNDKLVEKRPLSTQYLKGYLSPDGKYLFYITQTGEAYVTNSQTLAQTRLSLPLKEFHAVVWDANSSTLAIVQDHEALFATDVLYLFSIRE